jgi:putative membrane protein
MSLEGSVSHVPIVWNRTKAKSAEPTASGAVSIKTEINFMKWIAIAFSAGLAVLPLSLASAAEMPAQDFTQKAAQSDMFEIQAAKLELANGKSAEVKAFAGAMVKDHGKSTKALKRAAAKDGAKLPSDMGAELSQKLASLKSLNGPALDAAYVSTQVSVHTAATELFDTYSKDGQAGAVKAFAQKTYPTIRMHLVRVRNFNVEQ